jgi:hypothetical protein
MVDPEDIGAVKGYDGEGLIQLPEVDVIDGKTVTGEELRDSNSWADSHFLRGTTSDGETDKCTERGKTAALK